MKKAVTINEIADQLGMSRNTVAKALNGKYVPEKTRELVLGKARELNYKSLGVGIASSGDKHRRILLFSVKPLAGMKFFVPIIRGVENLCFAEGYELYQYSFNPAVTSFTAVADYIKKTEIDGIIAAETFDKEYAVKLLNLDKPICFIDFSATSTPIIGNYDIVETANTRPVYELTRQLHRQYGTTKFCYVGDYTHCLSFEERYFGMIQALAIDKIEHSPRDDIFKSDNFNYGSEVALKAEIIKLRNVPECFICCNDFVARAVCNALKSLNIDVPNKCFVVGYDNVAEACSAHPQITSFGSNKEFIGAEAMRTLITRMQSDNTIPTRIITVRAKVVYRESTER